jgi:predicted O-methyltransferase YrrM
MIHELKAFAKAHHVPIVCDDGLLFLKDVIQEHQIKNVLEIGTAIGYSAIAMALFGVKVDTIERDSKMQLLAEKNIKSFHLEDQIHLICADALTYEGPLGTYDMLFIDAAKAQYILFFEKYSPYIKPGGLIICDNLSFHDLDPQNVNRNTRQLLRKIETFKTYLKENNAYQTTFYTIGDGMSLSRKVAK